MKAQLTTLMTLMTRQGPLKSEGAILIMTIMALSRLSTGGVRIHVRSGSGASALHGVLGFAHWEGQGMLEFLGGCLVCLCDAQ